MSAILYEGLGHPGTWILSPQAENDCADSTLPLLDLVWPSSTSAWGHVPLTGECPPCQGSGEHPVFLLPHFLDRTLWPLSANAFVFAIGYKGFSAS